MQDCTLAGNLEKNKKIVYVEGKLSEMYESLGINELCGAESILRS
jgi:hypothetical protein